MRQYNYYYISLRVFDIRYEEWESNSLTYDYWIEVSDNEDHQLAII